MLQYYDAEIDLQFESQPSDLFWELIGLFGIKFV